MLRGSWNCFLKSSPSPDTLKRRSEIYSGSIQSVSDMRLLSAGYLLSIINALLFAFPTVLYLPALGAYPVSIILRGWGWRSLRKRLGGLGQLYLAIWALGATTYALILLAIFDIIELRRYGLWIAMATWATYSAIEAALYLRTASRLKLRPLYFSPISLVGVSIIVLAFVLLSAQGTTIQLTGEFRYGQMTPLIFAASASLTASALLTALTTLRIGAIAPSGERELEALLVTTPQRATPRRPPQPSTTPQTREEQERKTTQPASISRPLIRIEVISRGETLVCLNCGESAPIGSDKCTSCGEQFKKSSTALRCPVCKAPFSLAKAVSKQHYVCGQCFSDLRVTQGA